MPHYLTKRQREILTFLDDFIAAKGYSPSLEEICAGLGLSSLATVHVHLKNLDEKRMIRRMPNRGRSIELTPAGLKWRAQKTEKKTAGWIAIPLLGRVAAGTPIEAIETPEQIEVPADFVRGREAFVLKVQGDSMINEQIRNGDLVIVEKRSTAENGETVVALLDDSEATVKKFYREPDGRVRLQPANDSLQPIVVESAACTIQGVVIGLLRKY
ncbi:MAG TPA: transcriptional repressor LexA [Candidatus Sumerlaeota bacterium]|nr:transcriptional repressor LexA [Candidatus Sumerlaeota bacterium]HPS00427.1 transcriptional repressor LexA [Candidatus Sumerlaeota bacterium]